MTKMCLNLWTFRVRLNHIQRDSLNWCITLWLLLLLLWMRWMERATTTTTTTENHNHAMYNAAPRRRIKTTRAKWWKNWKWLNCFRSNLNFPKMRETNDASVPTPLEFVYICVLSTLHAAHSVRYILFVFFLFFRSLVKFHWPRACMRVNVCVSRVCVCLCGSDE